MVNDVSETLFNVFDKVCVIFGAWENSSPEDELTDQHFVIFVFDSLIVYAFVISKILWKSILDVLIMRSVFGHFQQISILT